eukprot:gene757-1443_t
MLNKRGMVGKADLWSPINLSNTYGLLYDISNDSKTTTKSRNDAVITLCREQNSKVNGLHIYNLRIDSVGDIDVCDGIGIAALSKFAWSTNALNSSGSLCIQSSGKLLLDGIIIGVISPLPLQTGDILIFTLDCDKNEVHISINSEKPIAIVFKNNSSWEPPYVFAVCFRKTGWTVSFIEPPSNTAEGTNPNEMYNISTIWSNIRLKDGIIIWKNEGNVLVHFPNLSPLFDFNTTSDEIKYANCRDMSNELKHIDNADDEDDDVFKNTSVDHSTYTDNSNMSADVLEMIIVQIRMYSDQVIAILASPAVHSWLAIAPLTALKYLLTQTETRTYCLTTHLPSRLISVLVNILTMSSSSTSSSSQCSAAAEDLLMESLRLGLGPGMGQGLGPGLEPRLEPGLGVGCSMDYDDHIRQVVLESLQTRRYCSPAILLLLAKILYKSSVSSSSTTGAYEDIIQNTTTTRNNNNNNNNNNSNSNTNTTTTNSNNNSKNTTTTTSLPASSSSYINENAFDIDILELILGVDITCQAIGLRVNPWLHIAQCVHKFEQCDAVTDEAFSSDGKTATFITEASGSRMSSILAFVLVKKTRCIMNCILNTIKSDVTVISIGIGSKICPIGSNFGDRTHSFGLCNNYSTSMSEQRRDHHDARSCLLQDGNVIEYWRPFKKGDRFLLVLDLTHGIFEINVNNGELKHRFSLKPCSFQLDRDDLAMGVSLSDGVSVSICPSNYMYSDLDWMTIDDETAAADTSRISTSTTTAATNTTTTSSTSTSDVFNKDIMNTCLLNLLTTAHDLLQENIGSSDVVSSITLLEKIDGNNNISNNKESLVKESNHIFSSLYSHNNYSNKNNNNENYNVLENVINDNDNIEADVEDDVEGNLHSVGTDLQLLIAVGNSDAKAAICVAKTIFNCIFHEIISIISNDTRKNTNNNTSNSNSNDNSNNDNNNMENKVESDLISLSFKILRCISGSRFFRLIPHHLCQVLFTRAGLRSQIIIDGSLTSDGDRILAVGSSAKLAYNLMCRMIQLESWFISIIKRIMIAPLFPPSPSSLPLQLSAPNSTAPGEYPNLLPFSRHSVKKCCSLISNAVRMNGFRVLADAIVSKTRDEEGNVIAGIRAALLDYVSTYARFHPSTEELRRLIQLICKHASPEALSHLEGIWTDAVTQWVVAEISTLVKRSKHLSHANEALVAAVSLVNHLILLLQRARAVSRMELAKSLLCYMSADIAFEAAYRRLPVHISLELTKALAMRISSLLDASKLDVPHSQWAKTLNDTSDLIQVLCNQSTIEFQHFYELLLSRRLLRCRFLSLSTEKKALASLPAMSKSETMIRDIEQTPQHMVNFQKFLMNRIDFQGLFLDAGTLSLAFSEDCLNIHIITASMWPCTYLSTMEFKSLILPPNAKLLINEFIRFFDEENIRQTRLTKKTSSSYSSTTSSSLFSSSSSRVNSMDTAAINPASAVMSALFPLAGADSGRSTGRTLRWSHGAGTATLQGRIRNGRSVFLVVDEPQMSLLCTYNNHSSNTSNGLFTQGNNELSLSESISITVNELCSATGLSLSGMTALVTSLSRTPVNIVTVHRDSAVIIDFSVLLLSDIISLSEQFLNGDLGGLSESDPIYTSSVYFSTSRDSQSFHTNATSVFLWRNELVDASIVRILKKSHIHRNGLFMNSAGTMHTALSLDVLIQEVKTNLRDRCDVCEEDVMRRIERLVASGIIEKVVGNKDSMRSVGYSYFQEGNEHNNSGNNDNNSEVKVEAKRVFGEELFSHLYERSGEVVILQILIEAISTANCQLQSLIHQHIYGRESVKDEVLRPSLAQINPIQGITTLAAEIANLSTASKHMFSTCIRKVFFEHLPLSVIELILIEYRRGIENCHYVDGCMNNDDPNSPFVDKYHSLGVSLSAAVQALLLKDLEDNDNNNGSVNEVNAAMDSEDVLETIASQWMERKPISTLWLAEVTGRIMCTPANPAFKLALQSKLYSFVAGTSSVASTAKSRTKRSGTTARGRREHNNRDRDRGVSSNASPSAREVRSPSFNFSTEPLSMESQRLAAGFAPLRINTTRLDLAHSPTPPPIQIVTTTGDILVNRPPLPQHHQQHQVEAKVESNSSSAVVSDEEDLPRARTTSANGLADVYSKPTASNNGIKFMSLGEFAYTLIGVAFDAGLSRSYLAEILSQNRLSSKETFGTFFDNIVMIGLVSQLQAMLHPHSASNSNSTNTNIRHGSGSDAISKTPSLLSSRNSSKMSSRMSSRNSSQASSRRSSIPSQVSTSPTFGFSSNSFYGLDVNNLSETATSLTAGNAAGVPSSMFSFDFLDDGTIVPTSSSRMEPLSTSSEIQHQKSIEMPPDILKMSSYESHKEGSCDHHQTHHVHTAATGCRSSNSSPASQLVFQLLNATIAAASETISSSNHSHSHSHRHDNHTAVVNQRSSGRSLPLGRSMKPMSSTTCQISSSKTFVEMLNRCFETLDCNKDGRLTVEDFQSTFSWPQNIDSDSAFFMHGDISSPLIPRMFSGKRGGFTKRSSKFLRSINDEDHNNELSETLPSRSSYRRQDSAYASIALATPTRFEMYRSFRDLEEAEKEMMTMIDRVKDVLNVSEAEILVLLVDYNWDVKRLIEMYLEDARLVRREVGLGPVSLPAVLRYDLFLRCMASGTGSSTSPSPSKDCRSSNSDNIIKEQQQQKQQQVSISPPRQTKGRKYHIQVDADLSDIVAEVKCGICWNISPSHLMYALCCRHWFCGDCWGKYIEVATVSRNPEIRCPQLDCRMRVTSALTSLVASHENPKGCEGVLLMADDADVTQACCAVCRSVFCANCDALPHAPATCDMIRKWEEKNGYLETTNFTSNELEARKLKFKISKPCPRCGVRIEKTGGCSHMVCVRSAGGCGFEFCWECLGLYHTNGECDRPKVKGSAGSVLAFDELDRQCAAHFLGCRTALRGQSDCRRRMEVVQQPAEARFLRIKAEAWQALAEAQSALAHSCIVAYFVSSAKLHVLYEGFGALTLSLQRKCEEEWMSVERFPETEAKQAVRGLLLRLRDYLLTVRTEIIGDNGVETSQNRTRRQNTMSSSPRSQRTESSGFGVCKEITIRFDK